MVSCRPAHRSVDDGGTRADQVGELAHHSATSPTRARARGIPLTHSHLAPPYTSHSPQRVPTPGSRSAPPVCGTRTHAACACMSDCAAVSSASPLFDKFLSSNSGSHNGYSVQL
eukprot:311316-Prymnesium_polylepis.1